MGDLIPFGSGTYFTIFGLLIFARGMDFLSTWIGTPNLVLEGNPLARRLGWKGGIWLNVVLCLLFAGWPLPAIVIMTASLLVAGRNLQSAWLMRSLGEHRYRLWFAERLAESSKRLFVFCLLAQTLFLSAIGGALMYFSSLELVPFAIGMGFITYGWAVAFYTLLSLRKMGRPAVAAVETAVRLAKNI